ncbi:hypothetical protein AB0K18_43050 [Nonomuraea sp. NPDC049421]|uniref:hypothetical protein n=1 Tax=Nonomuraea sp. NPDC049421 TaxID=3155275 RepID=UPI003436E615
MSTTLPAAALRGRDLYDRVLQELDREQTLGYDHKFWNQNSWRSLHPSQFSHYDQRAWNPGRGRNGTMMCFGALACDLAGGRWLVDVTDSGPTVNGKQLDLLHFRWADLELLHAEPDDHPSHITTLYDHRVIDVEYRAHRLLQVKHLTPFYERRDLDLLRAKRDEIYS